MNTGLEELRERMEHATAGIEVPSGLARRAAQNRRRRILARATAAGTAVVLAGVAIAATTATGPGEHGTIAGARLVSDIRSALDAVATGNDVVYLRSPDGLHELWSYHGTQQTLRRNETFSAQGRPIVDQGTTETSASVRFLFVNYKAKTWFTQTIKLDLLSAHPGPTSCASPVGLSIMQDPAELTANIREALSCGQLTDEGTENINGVSAIKLVSVRNPGSKMVVTMTLWVNRATYLPVRWALSFTATRSDGTTFHAGRTYDVWWLPPTRANVADLRVPIPAGFTQSGS